MSSVLEAHKVTCVLSNPGRMVTGAASVRLREPRQSLNQHCGRNDGWPMWKGETASWCFANPSVTKCPTARFIFWARLLRKVYVCWKGFEFTWWKTRWTSSETNCRQEWQDKQYCTVFFFKVGFNLQLVFRRCVPRLMQQLPKRIKVTKTFYVVHQRWITVTMTTAFVVTINSSSG